MSASPSAVIHYYLERTLMHTVLERLMPCTNLSTDVAYGLWTTCCILCRLMLSSVLHASCS